jgi:hypothetical protein
MYLLIAIIMFVVGAIGAATEGDFSGLKAIAKVIGFFALWFAALWLFTQPALLIIVIAVIVIVCCLLGLKW